MARKPRKRFPCRELDWLTENSPVILMGGQDSDEWDIHPERPAILIGTQDMLSEPGAQSRLWHEPLPLADALRPAEQRCAVGDG